MKPDAFSAADGRLTLHRLQARSMRRPDPQAALRGALEQPVAGPPLAQVLAGGRSLVIVISDGTRHTHSHLVVPTLLAAAAAAGIPAGACSVVIARGLHPPVPIPVQERLLGEAWGKVWVVEHDGDRGELAPLGTTSRGTPVELNRLAAEADRLVLTGAVGYHYYAGYGGGRKGLVPGLASRLTIQANHRLMLLPSGEVHPQARAGVLAGNPVHEDMVEAAALARPHFLVNVVNRPDGELAACFAGDWQQAHTEAVRFLDRYCRLQVSELQPLVLADAGGSPYDLTLYQAHKAMDAAARLVADGGVLILRARCPQGLGPPEYADFLAWKQPARILQRLRLGRYCVPAQTAHATLTKTQRIRVILVSDRLHPDDAHRAGALLAENMEQALVMAARKLGSLPPAALAIPAAGSLLVEVTGT